MLSVHFFLNVRVWNTIFCRFHSVASTMALLMIKSYKLLYINELCFEIKINIVISINFLYLHPEKLIFEF